MKQQITLQSYFHLSQRPIIPFLTQLTLGNISKEEKYHENTK